MDNRSKGKCRAITREFSPDIPRLRMNALESVRFVSIVVYDARITPSMRKSLLPEFILSHLRTYSPSLGKIPFNCFRRPTPPAVGIWESKRVGGITT